MVNLDLLPRKEFILTLSNGAQVRGQFSTWSLSRFGDKRKASLAKINEILTTDPALSELLDFAICAVEAKGDKITEQELCNWIDDYSEATGETGVLIKLLAHASGDQKDEKKSPPQALSGENSSDTPPVQE